MKLGSWTFVGLLLVAAAPVGLADSLTCEPFGMLCVATHHRAYDSCDGADQYGYAEDGVVVGWGGGAAYASDDCYAEGGGYSEANVRAGAVLDVPTGTAGAEARWSAVRDASGARCDMAAFLGIPLVGGTWKDLGSCPAGNPPREPFGILP